MTRKITSLTSLLSFIVTLVTSVVLYITPHGRVAYWSDWTFWGLSKTQWGDIHITVGLLFLLASLWHIWLNWKPITTYMKNKARDLVVFTRPMLVSVVLTLAVLVGTLLHLPPMQQVLDLAEHIKEVQTATYGNPPYGHAELSKLNKFCSYMGFDVDAALAALREAGYTERLAPDTVLVELAHANGATPQQVYIVMRDALAGKDPFAALPANPPEGLGKMKLADICANFGLPVNEALHKLTSGGMKAAADMTLKQIAAENGVTPRDIYQLLMKTE
ncbi:DUF4405 domain-containing protein [Salidesulfovibrio onnuriiensis]|uniref:DUF4405 domain-containing protein n=1 Tax=Salidesulfovibrio onnuriiensis TaxID=2583823 RepID=UPI0011C7D80E|nr:DUF4405 domain-containing protein [Salidesulfovibrio onnuriiensis]